MPRTIKSELYEVQVHFDANAQPPFRFSGDIAPPCQIIVESYMALIVLKLVVAPKSPDATFLGSPIEWFLSESQPGPVPPPFTVQRDHGKQVTIVDINTAGTKEGLRFGFRVTVVDENGKPYTSIDPTVINKEPPIPKEQAEPVRKAALESVA